MEDAPPEPNESRTDDVIDSCVPLPTEVRAHRAGALRRAAVRASQAPSVLNTQPWLLRIHDGALFVHADHSRQLMALDPQRRLLTTSVGCATYAARAGLAADGYDTVVHRVPDPTHPDLLAVLEPVGPPVPSVAPAPAAVRVQPASGYLPPSVAAAVSRAVAHEGVRLRLLGVGERQLVAALSREADAIENLDLTYRAELDTWAGDGGRHRVECPDQCLALLITDGDTPWHWLRAGEALLRAVDEAAAHGYELAPSTQVVEVPSERARLRRALGLAGHPQVLLRWRPEAAPATSRRRLVDVLAEES